MASFPVPPVFPIVTTPLPPGWTQHTAPGGQLYYYHAETKQSTYIRPVLMLGQTPAPSTSEQSKPTKKKKEKPTVKTPIPGTDWTRVKTTEGNIFYTNREKKESVWTVPEEIAEAVEELERKEIEEETERKIKELEENATRQLIPPPPTEAPKRKANLAPDTRKGKKTKVDSNIERPPAPKKEAKEELDEEEAWQREVAEEMAAEVEKPDTQKQYTDGTNTEKALPSQYNMPNKVDLTTEEKKALFKTLLQEKDISPLTPYDSALPQLIKDPRFVLLSNITDRHAAFNEYCLEKSRALRAAKQATHSESPGNADSKSSEKQKNREAYDSLLEAELTSTRTSWDEFRRKWKKDRRFFGFGRDDREREKVFREYRNTLGERKRKAAQIAETNLFALLRENEKLIPDEALWKDVKKHKVIYQDPRYDAVGSSSLREELFAAFLKSRSNTEGTQSTKDENPDSSKPVAQGPADEEAKKRMRQERIEKGLKEREAKVQQEKAKLDRDIGKSRGNMTGERGVEEYQSLLTDAIRDPLATFQSSAQHLSQFPAFANSPLPHPQKVSLFNAHVARLRQKQIAALHALFEGYTPSLDARFKDLPESLWTSAPATKLGLSSSDEDSANSKDRKTSEMRRLWEDWQDDRNKSARAAFDKLLEENSFVGFWGGVGKMGKEGKEGAGSGLNIGVDDLEGEDAQEEEESGKVDLKNLAKGIGERQIEDVLKHDKRYRVFDHIPEQRERWIKEYLNKLSAPKLSVHTAQEQ
ncbi:hypothetical protein FRC02_007773 [Tulasnella sp. 418]|nr:hypothetical protein FRC02_007773 [Tulasnella sp. 418]